MVTLVFGWLPALFRPLHLPKAIFLGRQLFNINKDLSVNQVIFRDFSYININWKKKSEVMTLNNNYKPFFFENIIYPLEIIPKNLSLFPFADL